MEPVIENIIQGTVGGDVIQGTGANDQVNGGEGDDDISGGSGDDFLLGEGGSDVISGGAGNDVIEGGAERDILNGDEGNDVISGGDGNDKVAGGMGDDTLSGGEGDDKVNGGRGNDDMDGGRGADIMNGGAGDDILRGKAGNDTLEGGAGNDTLSGGGGDDLLYAFSWGGEPVPDQDADALVNKNEPVEDTDVLRGGKGADTFEFRWLLDAKDEMLDKHRDETGDIDYSGNGVAGENGNTHDHWVEHIGTKIVKDYNEAEGDTLVFAGHTVNLDTVTHTDYNGDGVTDTVLTFVSNQGGNGGAHDGDELGTVVILNNVIDTVDVDAGVFYGVEDPWSAAG